MLVKGQGNNAHWGRIQSGGDGGGGGDSILFGKVQKEWMMVKMQCR